MAPIDAPLDTALGSLQEATRVIRMAWRDADVAAALAKTSEKARWDGEIYEVFRALADLLGQLQQHQATGAKWAMLLDVAQVPIDGRRPDEMHVADVIARVLREQRKTIAFQRDTIAKLQSEKGQLQATLGQQAGAHLAEQAAIDRELDEAGVINGARADRVKVVCQMSSILRKDFASRNDEMVRLHGEVKRLQEENLKARRLNFAQEWPQAMATVPGAPPPSSVSAVVLTKVVAEAHDVLNKAGCPLPRFDATNGATLPDRIAAIVKQRDRAQRRAGVPNEVDAQAGIISASVEAIAARKSPGTMHDACELAKEVLRLRNRKVFGVDFSRMKDGDVIVTDNGTHVLRTVDGPRPDIAKQVAKFVGECKARFDNAPPPATEVVRDVYGRVGVRFVEPPASMQVDQAHQCLSRHGVPQAFGSTNAPTTLVERIDALAATRESFRETALSTVADVQPLRDEAKNLRAENHRLNDHIEHLSTTGGEATSLRRLLFEVLVGMRNSPVARAQALLAAHGMPIPANTDTFESMREQRDNAHVEAERFRQAIGMMATAKPNMVMRPHDPVGMAQEVVAEFERLRMQLTACSVLAGSNTRESLAKHRVMHPDYDCDAVRNVIDAVQREIAMREAIESLRKDLASMPNLQAALGEAKAKLDAIHRFAHHAIGADGKSKAEPLAPKAAPAASQEEDGA